MMNVKGCHALYKKIKSSQPVIGGENTKRFSSAAIYKLGNEIR